MQVQPKTPLRRLARRCALQWVVGMAVLTAVWALGASAAVIVTVAAAVAVVAVVVNR
jgi:hypothetical protein